MRRLFILLLIAPLAAAGTPDEPDITDAPGDAGSLPCSPAVDVLAFWAVWADEGVEFHYRLADLSVIAERAVAQDQTGRCFYSYTDFVADVGGQTKTESVYVDHIESPIFVSGWRFYLHESGVDLAGDVDIAGGKITVTVPYSWLGQPDAGDRIGGFRLQATTNVEGAGLAYQTDWAPDSSQACECWVEAFPGSVAGDANATGNANAKGDATDDVDGPAKKASGASWSMVAGAAAVAVLARRRASGRV